MNTLEQLKMQRLMMKGVVSDLDQQDRMAVNDAIASIQAVLDKHPKCGAMALAIMVCEMGIAEEEKKSK